MSNLQLKNRAIIKSEPVPLFEKESTDSRWELLTIDEVKDILKISKSGVRRLYQGRQVPFIKVGNSIRFLKSDVFAYLAKRRVGSIE